VAEPRSATRRATFVLAATLVLVAVLGLIGLGVEGRLQPTSLAIGGTSSAQGEALAQRHFGESSPFAVLLRGPAGAIEQQGPRLAAALRREPRVTVISPWDGAAVSRKLPAPPRGTPASARSRALLLLDFHLPQAESDSCCRAREIVA
jgi:uncharacterized membrane protein YdfJ with MMPL/SSD domain